MSDKIAIPNLAEHCTDKINKFIILLFVLDDMVEGQTGLNIKDYPFAFSIAVLFYPNILSDINDNHVILGILLIGGMLGSLLTIINPLGLLIKYYYTRNYSNLIYYIIFPSMFPAKNTMIKNIAQKNFRSALTAPTISFETDKIVAMLYFIIILGVAIIRLLLGNFTSLGNSNLLPIMGLLSIGGLAGVILVLMHHVYGVNFKTEIFEFRGIKLRKFQQTGLSQLDRIRLVTIANLAIDCANLDIEIEKWRSNGLQSPAIRYNVLNKFYKLDKSVSKNLSPKITTSQESFKEFASKEIGNIYSQNNHSWNNEIIDYLYQRYASMKEISERYDVEFSEALAWMFDQNQTLSGLYDIETDVRTSIESRDWDSADLISYRITDVLENYLKRKKIPDRITEEPFV